MQRFIEDRRASGAFKIAAEAELQLRAIEGRRRQMAPERRNIEHRKNVTGHPKDFFKRLAEPFQGCKRINTLDAGGARHRRIVDVRGKRHRQFVRGAVAPVRR